MVLMTVVVMGIVITIVIFLVTVLVMGVDGCDER